MTQLLHALTCQWELSASGFEGLIGPGCRMCQCYTEKPKDAWDRHKRHEIRHDQKQQRSDYELPVSISSLIITLQRVLFPITKRTTLQQALLPNEHAGLISEAQHPADAPNSSQAMTECTPQHRNQNAHAHVSAS